MVRVWTDWNSYATPTVCYERTDHLPYYPPRVDYFRWMYGKGPGETPAHILYAPNAIVSQENVILPGVPIESNTQPTPASPQVPPVEPYVIPPAPQAKSKQPADDYDLINHSTAQRQYTPLPRRSWMFNGQ